MRLPFNGSFRISQVWGVNPETYSRFGLKGHNGIDYALPTGTKLLAPHKGTVKEVAFDAEGYGNYIKIESSIEGSVLAHCKSILVKQGDEVSEGQEVAISDNTGFSTGPHLHWGYYKIPRDRSDGYLGYINQAPLIDVSSIYKGLDLNNEESMKIAVDVWRDLADGKYISIDQHTKVINELDAKSTAQATQYDREKQVLQEKIKTLEEIIKNIQEVEHSWSTTADTLERKLRAVLGVFARENNPISLELEADSMADSVSRYITSLKKDSGDFLEVSQELKEALKKIDRLEKPYSIQIGKLLIKYTYG